MLYSGGVSDQTFVVGAEHVLTCDSFHATVVGSQLAEATTLSQQ